MFHRPMVWTVPINEIDFTARLATLAADHESPMEPDLMTVKRDPFLITIDVPYTETVNLLPGQDVLTVPDWNKIIDGTTTSAFIPGRSSPRSMMPTRAAG